MQQGDTLTQRTWSRSHQMDSCRKQRVNLGSSLSRAVTRSPSELQQVRGNSEKIISFADVCGGFFREGRSGSEEKHRSLTVVKLEMETGTLCWSEAWPLNDERVVVEVVLSEQSQHAELRWVHENKQLILWAVNPVKTCFLSTRVFFLTHHHNNPKLCTSVPCLLTLAVHSSLWHIPQTPAGWRAPSAALAPNKGSVPATSLKPAAADHQLATAAEHTPQLWPQWIYKFHYLYRVGFQKSHRKLHY